MKVKYGPNASPEVQELATRLAQYLGQLTGYDHGPVQDTTGQTGIALGRPSDFTPALLASELPPEPGIADRETHVLRSHAGGLYVLGAEAGFPGAPPIAVSNAMWDLLHRLGHRQLLPGPKWEVWPPADAPTGIAVDVLARPAYAMRRIYETGNVPDPQAVDDWKAKNLALSAIDGSIGDLLTAVPPDGSPSDPPDTRETIGSITHLCLSHPAVVEWVKSRAVTILSSQPHLDMVSVEPWDSYAPCSWETSANKAPSDIIVDLANAVAGRLHEVGLDDRFVNFRAYGAHSSPPTSELHDNVVVVINTGYGAASLVPLVTAWSAKLAPATWGTRATIALGDYYGNTGETGNLARPGRSSASDTTYVAASIVSFHDPSRPYNLFAAQSSDSWAPEGLGYYLATKVLWNKNDGVDTSAVLDDAITRTFGPAAPAMNRLMRTRLAAEEGHPFSRDVVGAICRDVQEALSLATGDATVTARVADFGLYARYLDLLLHTQPDATDTEANRLLVWQHLYRMRESLMVHSQSICTEAKTKEKKADHKLYLASWPAGCDCATAWMAPATTTCAGWDPSPISLTELQAMLDDCATSNPPVFPTGGPSFSTDLARAWSGPLVSSVCGDLVCGSTETCESCSTDCGQCPLANSEVRLHLRASATGVLPAVKVAAGIASSTTWSLIREAPAGDTVLQYGEVTGPMTDIGLSAISVAGAGDARYRLDVVGKDYDFVTTPVPGGARVTRSTRHLRKLGGSGESGWFYVPPGTKQLAVWGLNGRIVDPVSGKVSGGSLFDGQGNWVTTAEGCQSSQTPPRATACDQPDAWMVVPVLPHQTGMWQWSAWASHNSDIFALRGVPPYIAKDPSELELPREVDLVPGGLGDSRPRAFPTWLDGTTRHAIWVGYDGAFPPFTVTQLDTPIAATWQIRDSLGRPVSGQSGTLGSDNAAHTVTPSVPAPGLYTLEISAHLFNVQVDPGRSSLIIENLPAAYEAQGYIYVPEGTTTVSIHGLQAAYFDDERGAPDSVVDYTTGQAAGADAYTQVPLPHAGLWAIRRMSGVGLSFVNAPPYLAASPDELLLPATARYHVYDAPLALEVPTGPAPSPDPFRAQANLMKDLAQFYVRIDEGGAFPTFTAPQGAPSWELWTAHAGPLNSADAENALRSYGTCSAGTCAIPNPGPGLYRLDFASPDYFDIDHAPALGARTVRSAKGIPWIYESEGFLSVPPSTTGEAEVDVVVYGLNSAANFWDGQGALRTYALRGPGDYTVVRGAPGIWQVSNVSGADVRFLGVPPYLAASPDELLVVP